MIHVSLSLKEDVKLNETENAWKPARLVKGSAQNEEDAKTAVSKELKILYTPNECYILIKTFICRSYTRKYEVF